MSADRISDCTQKLQATISAAVESLIVYHVRFFLGPTDVQPVTICLIWCRVVRSRDFSASPLLTLCFYHNPVFSFIHFYTSPLFFLYVCNQRTVQIQ